MHVVKDPCDEFMRVVMFVVIEKLISLFYSCDEFLVIENTLRLFLSVYILEEVLYFVENAVLLSCWDLHI